MHPQRKQRLLIIVFMLLGIGIAVGLMLYALKENINLFYTPSQMANGEVPADRLVRAGGLVVVGSLQRDPNSLLATFKVTDGVAEVTIQYSGILPDLFREGQGIVAMGKLNEQGVFIASEVLAKHDEKYMPPEVTHALEQAHKDGKQDIQSARE